MDATHDDLIPYMPALTSYPVEIEIVEVSVGAPVFYPDDFYTDEV